jgi:signal transduction histidine kinase
MRDDQPAISALRRPNAGEWRAAAACACLLVVGVVMVRPFAAVPLVGAAPLLPAYAAVVLALDLLAATLLLSLYAAVGAPALLALAAAYLFNGLTVIAWAASFPGVFAPQGLLGGDLQTTAVIAGFRRVAFPLCVLAYAALRLRDPNAGAWRPHSSAGAAAVVVGAVFASAAAMGAAVALSGSVTPLMADARVPTTAWDMVLWASIGLTALAMAALVRLRPFSCLDLWLLVTLGAFVVELVMLGFVAEGVRFSLGWWAGRMFGLAAVGFVALALLVETVGMTARSVTALMAEVQARRARESTLEALGAAIAHELNQPLAAIVTGAEAAGRWLDRPEPDLDRARERLAAISEDGVRAGRVLAGLRRSFARRPTAGRPVEARALLLSVAALVREQAAAAGVRLTIDRAGEGLTARGDEDQLRQALLNVVVNAIEATASTQGAPRAVTAAARAEAGGVVLSVSDTGPGVPDAMTDAIFDAFRSGKPQGMGLGLMISRTIVEAHGGRITASNRPGGGALFEIVLPREANDD